MSLFGLLVYLCSFSFISCRIKWEGKRLKINTLRPSLKEGHVNVRHQNVPLLIVTFFFFFLAVSLLFRGRVVFEPSQTILNRWFSILFPTFIIFCKDIHNSCEGGAKFFSFFFPPRGNDFVRMPLPKSSPTLLCKSYQVYRSGAFVLGIFFPQRVHPAVVLNGTDAWKAVVIYALMSFILLKPDAISSVPVPSLTSFLFLMRFHLSLASAQVPSSFLEGTWNIVPCPPLYPETLSSLCRLPLLLLEIVVHVSVISLKMFCFSFEENVLRSFDCDECCCSAKI